MKQTLLDTGPLVAFCNEADEAHEWASQEFRRLRGPLLTCEPVLAEAAHLLPKVGVDPAEVLDLVSQGILKVPLNLEQEAVALAILMRRYRDQPMDLADACVVRMAELFEDCQVLTVDTEFQVYRRHGRQRIPLIAPFAG